MFEYSLTTDVLPVLNDLLGTPFLRSSATPGRNFPPYNILRFDDGSCLLELAVAGYTKDRLSVQQEENTLIVKGSAKKEMPLGFSEYVKQGIANSAWVRTFDIDSNSKIGTVSVTDGVLRVSLTKKLQDPPPRIDFEIK